MKEYLVLLNDKGVHECRQFPEALEKCVELGRGQICSNVFNYEAPKKKADSSDKNFSTLPNPEKG